MKSTIILELLENIFLGTTTNILPYCPYCHPFCEEGG
jgi:hypothetical protein